jgi:hypothetical protein
LGALKEPSALVTVFVAILVSTFLMDISTPGIFDPLGSITVPLIVAPTTCAEIGAEREIPSSITKRNAVRVQLSLNFERAMA